jgi:DNA-binding GntR family transcriptional regulator
VTASATLAETIADQLRTDIRTGVYVSGERLVELTLAQRLNVSQNTIRDALRLLESEGWVVKHARHGVYVRAFTRDEAAELYALWAAIEGLALGWAMQVITRKDLALLRRLIQDARRETLTNGVRGAVEKIFQFHTAILDISNKPQTAQLLSTLHNRIYLLEVVRQMRAPRSLHNHEARLLLYEKLVSVIEAGDAASAQDLLQFLISSDWETLQPLLK